MNPDIKEGIEEVSPEEFTDELRGVVIDEVASGRRNIWIGLGITSLVVMLFASWGYFYFSHTRTELLQAQLRSHMMVRTRLKKAQDVIKNPGARGEEVKSAIIAAIDTVGTPLRQADLARAPYIPERQLAMIIALEGLLRIQLNHELEFDNPADHRYFQEQLSRLGRCEIEYYENGLLQRIPLLHAASIQEQIHSKQQNVRLVDQGEIKDLEATLEGTKSSESFTVVAPAYLLGRWYRYHNDMKNAERSFHIGRKYVEGYRFGNKLLSGKRPQELSPLWEEYFGCVDALASIAYQQQNYRQARSYLVRMFNTPNSSNAFEKHRLTPGRAVATASRLKALRNDVEVLQRAIAFPLELSSFPSFSATATTCDWERLISRLAQAEKNPGRTASHLLLEQLDPSSRQKIKDGERTEPLEHAIIGAINQLIHDSSFYKRAMYEERGLSSRSKSLLNKGNQRALSREELSFLNRDIIDTSFVDALTDPYILSDGTRLHNALGPQQTPLLMTFYEQDIRAATDPKESARLRTLVEEIYQHRHQPTLHDLHARLSQERETIEESTRAVTATIASHKEALEQVYEQVRELDSQTTLDIDAILRLQERHKQTEARWQQAIREKGRLAKHHRQIQDHYRDLSINLRQQLADVQAQLAILENRPETAEEASPQQNEPYLAQIERQMGLRKQYVKLLEELKLTKGNLRLDEILHRRQVLDAGVDELRQRLSNSRGDEREGIGAELQKLEQEQHELVVEFNRLFSPLRNVVDAIAADEKEILKAQLQLRQVREEILRLIGTAEVRGSLQAKTLKRTSLLLMKSDDAVGTPLYDAELRLVSKEIAADYAHLQLLLETEKAAKVSLTTFYPEAFTAAGEPRDGLTTLQRYLDRQQKLAEQYSILSRESTIIEEIHSQEKMVQDNLQLISSTLSDLGTLSDKQTHALSRHMRNMLRARTRLSQLKRHLKHTAERNVSLQASTAASLARGYLLDTAEMFQLEHDMGLNISEYVDAFDKRDGLITELQVLLQEKQKLEHQKLAATRRRNQAEIDLLIPKLTEKEAIIKTLTEKRR